MSAYPSHQDVHAVLRDGSTVRIRPVVRDDRDALKTFLEGLSEQSRIFRFFGPVKELGWAADRLTDLDYRTAHGLVALRGSATEIVGHGSYQATRESRAEIALEVGDSMQGQGLGTILIDHLAAAAAEAGITLFEAEVMITNHRMLKVFRDTGFPISTSSADGAISIEFPTSLTEEAVERFESRDRIAAVSALRRFLEPGSIAMVGASKRGTFGGEVFHNLLESGFPGLVHPVSPHPVVQSVPSFPDIRQVPGKVDLAVVAVRANAVASVARACAEKGVDALVVLSAGFAEVGPEGLARQGEVLTICRESGMRLLGPNCMGVINTHPDHRLNATFASAPPPEGRVGFMSQSGALGMAVVDYARETGLGLSAFVSVGNRADISTNDLLEYWEEDAGTELIMLYLESFGNPRRFSRIARRLSRRKPILAVKSGRTGAGAQATGSRTAALLAASDVTVDALFRQSGVIRTDTLRELFDVAALLADQPAPAGPRVGIVTNSRGLGALCADACVVGGLEVPDLPEATRLELTRSLPAGSVAGNPVHLNAGAPGEAYEQAISILGSGEDVDALIVIFIPPLPARVEEVAAAIRRGVGALHGAKPVLAVIMSVRGAVAELTADGVRIPSFRFPEDAARALTRAWEWAQQRDRPASPAAQPPLRARPDEATAIIAAALGSGEGWLGFQAAAGLLDCYGVGVASWRVAGTESEAVLAAREIGGPVALKAISPSLERKTDIGAVALDLRDQRAVRRAAKEIAQRVIEAGHPFDGLLVQAMAPRGVEMVVGVVHDPLFGPVMACSAGGDISTAVARDLSVRVSPIAADDADEMLRGLASYPLLEGSGGRPGVDVGSLRDLLLRLSALVEHHEEVAELDLSPVVAGANGAVVVDARVRLARPSSKGPYGARQRPGPA